MILRGGHKEAGERPESMGNGHQLGETGQREEHPVLGGVSVVKVSLELIEYLWGE